MSPDGERADAPTTFRSWKWNLNELGRPVAACAIGGFMASFLIFRALGTSDDGLVIVMAPPIVVGYVVFVVLAVRSRVVVSRTHLIKYGMIRETRISRSQITHLGLAVSGWYSMPVVIVEHGDAKEWTVLTMVSSEMAVRVAAALALPSWTDRPYPLGRLRWRGRWLVELF